MSDQDILKIAEVRADIFQDKMKMKVIGSDQMAISIYYKLYAKIKNEELSLLFELGGGKGTIFKYGSNSSHS